MITVIKEEYKYSELTSKIIGCAMTIHKTLSNGFQEIIYQRALGIELNLAGISFLREFEMPIYYRNEQIGTRRVDFLVEGLLRLNLRLLLNWRMFILHKLLTIWKHIIWRLDYSSILAKLA